MDVVKMPRLGVTMKAGKVSAWFKKEGDEVTRGEPLFELESEKSVVEIEAQADGILRRILVGEDEEVPVNTVIAVIASPGEEVDLSPYVNASQKPYEAAAGSVRDSKEVKAPASGSAKVKVAPRARKLAQELGVSLETLQGTGVGGLITEQDVLQASKNNPSLPIRETVVLNHVKQAMSKNMLNSWRNIPQFTQIISVKMDNVLKVKKELEGISINDILVKVVGIAANELPIVNSKLEENKVYIYEDVNVSVAIATDQGLVVPVVKSVQSKSVQSVSQEIKQLAQKARANQLNPEDFVNGTITVSNLGHFGIESGTPIINNPQSTIIFAGAIQKSPVVNEFDEIVVAPIMKLSVCFDHRFIDGVTAARFTQALKERLEKLEVNDLL